MRSLLIYLLISFSTQALHAQDDDISEKRTLKEAIDIGLRLGYASLPLQFTPANSDNTTSQQKGIPLIGLDLQYHLGFIENLSIYSDPTYFNIRHVQNVQGLVLTELDISLTSVSIPLGLRYFFPIQDDFHLFVNAAFEVLYDFDDTLIVTPPLQEVTIDSKNSWVAGAGLQAQRWVFELQYRSRYTFFSRAFDISTARLGVKVGYLIW